MRILQMTRFYYNGQTTHVFTLCQELQKLNHQVFLSASYLQDPTYVAWLRRYKIPHSPTANYPQLASRIQNLDFDLIHTHSAHTLKPALELGKSWGIPVIATCHYLDFPSRDDLAQADGIILISHEMEKIMEFVPETKRYLIENGVNVTPYVANRPTSPRTIALVTRMTSQKEPAYQNLVEVAVKMGWNVLSVGNWKPRNPQVQTIRWQQDLESILKGSHVVTGTGRAIREAMAAGCAGLVLGEFCDGLVTPENIEILRHHNFSGRATQQEATLDILKDQLELLTPEQIRELQRFGHRYSKQHFSIEKMTNETISVYDKVISSHKDHSTH